MENVEISFVRNKIKLNHFSASFFSPAFSLGDLKMMIVLCLLLKFHFHSN